MNKATDNLLEKELIDNEIIRKLAMLSDELDLDKRYGDSQEIDDFINMVNMQKESGLRDSFDDILNLFKDTLKLRNPRLRKRLQRVIDNNPPKPVSVNKGETSLKDLLDRQWGLTDEPSRAKDYTGELYPR